MRNAGVEAACTVPAAPPKAPSARGRGWVGGAGRSVLVKEAAPPLSGEWGPRGRPPPARLSDRSLARLSRVVRPWVGDQPRSPPRGLSGPPPSPPGRFGPSPPRLVPSAGGEGNPGLGPSPPAPRLHGLRLQRPQPSEGHARGRRSPDRKRSGPARSFPGLLLAVNRPVFWAVLPGGSFLEGMKINVVLQVLIKSTRLRPGDAT